MRFRLSDGELQRWIAWLREEEQKRKVNGKYLNNTEEWALHTALELEYYLKRELAFAQIMMALLFIALFAVGMWLV